MQVTGVLESKSREKMFKFIEHHLNDWVYSSQIVVLIAHLPAD